MSDYLWDKTGEPEEDVERLEGLLGQLRFQPRTFEVPAAIPVVARPVAPRTFSHSYAWRAAIAASLILTLLAGAWLVATRRRAGVTTPQMAKGATAPGNDSTARQADEQTTGQTAKGTTQPSDHQLASGATKEEEIARRGERSREGEKRRAFVERAGARDQIGRQRRELIAGARKRLVAPRRQLNEREVNAPREEIAKGLTVQEREAMEKFLLAMKVTSEKLGYAERQVQGLNESSPQR